MLPLLLILVVMGLSLGFIFGYPQWVQWKRERLLTHPFPEQWLATVQQSLPMYDALTVEQQKNLRNCVQILIAEKQFIGCQGVTVTMEMKVVISAIASLLLCHREHQFFPKLKTILVYPHPYRVQKQVHVGGGVTTVQEESRLGESWSRDQLVLAWDQIERDLRQWNDGRNLILHEFSHQLDQADGVAEGVPLLATKELYQQWSSVMSKEFNLLCKWVNQGRKTALDPYGTLNPAEFFAVATESFFEKPRQVSQKHPALYELLRQYYGVDPLADWL